jgi:hypothetical protein
MITLIAGGVAGITLFTLGALLWVRLSGYRCSPARDTVLNSEFSLTRLDPMARLAADEDLEFLKQFDTCRPRLVERWERDRRRIFRLYLSDAAGDFHRMHAEARRLMADAPEQYSDLVGVLMRQQVTFWRILTVIELRLLFSGLGFGKLEVAKLDGARIAAALEGMRAEVSRSISPASA